VDESAYVAILPRVERLKEAMQKHLADGRRGEIIRSGEEREGILMSTL